MKPTRAEMAECAGAAAALLNFSGQKNDLVVGLEAADAELRKTCAGCRHFSGQAAEHEFDGCLIGNNSPADGTGYCAHGWEAKWSANG